MDKYEFNIKVEQLKKAVKAGDYATAKKICDGIDWRRVSSVSLLSMVSEVYEKNYEYSEAKDILLMAYEKAPIGKRLIYKLCLLALNEGNIEEAEAFYREFYDLAPDDPRQYILRYSILRAKGAPYDQLINSLEAYTRTEPDERYMYELAELYHNAGRHEECVSMCDKIMLMFGIGNYVDRAIELKTVKEGVPLTDYQKGLIENREQYKEKLQEMDEEYVYTPDQTAFVEDNEEPVKSEPVVYEEPETPKPVVKEEPEAVIKQREPEPAAESVKPEPAEQPAKPAYTINFIVERKTPEAGLESAKRLLKLMHEHTGSTNSVTKIKASKLNTVGVKASSGKLAGKDLIVEEAGDLTFDTVEQIVELIREEPDKRIIVLIDNPMQLAKIQNAHPRILQYFHLDRDDAEEYAEKKKAAQAQTPAFKPAPATEPQTPAYKPARTEQPQPAPAIEPAAYEAPHFEEKLPEYTPAGANAKSVETVSVPEEPEMDIDDFANYCAEYAKSIDCSISGKSMLALYERIEIMEEDGIPLTKNNAVDLIEEAADRAEKKSLGNLFSKKYDKNDMLILKEEHFIP